MSMDKFENLKITTMTVIVKLKGSVFIDNVFPLLNITRLDLPERKRRTKKYKLPYCGIPGAIITVKYGSETRGIIKTKSKKSFLNSITIDICTSKKNINAKLSRSKIHMCGPDSEELAMETASYIIEHIERLQNELNEINKDEKLKKRSINWLIENSRGDEYIIDDESQYILSLEDGDEFKEVEGIGRIIDKNGNVKYKDVTMAFDGWSRGDKITKDLVVVNENGEPYIVLNKGNKEVAVLNETFFIKEIELEDAGTAYEYVGANGKKIKIVKTVPIKASKVLSIKIPNEYPDKYPNGISENIVNFYTKYAPDFSYHHVYSEFLNKIQRIDTLYEGNINIDRLDMAMINYSYSLNMSIDRWKLANYIKGRNGFNSRYCDSTDHSVTISLPYKLTEEQKNVRRKGKPPRHTFMVHRSGIVTQSGPNIKMMREAYELFVRTIEEIKDYIIQEGKPFKVKYRKRNKENDSLSDSSGEVVEKKVGCE